MRRNTWNRSAGALVLSGLLVWASGCGGNADGAGPVPQFYDAPNPLTPAAAGTVIKTGSIPRTPGGVRAHRIMYHSRTNRGEDIATTGFLVLPDRDPPPGGWPLVAAAHGTTGIIPACAPSIDPFVPGPFAVDRKSYYEFFAEPWVAAGFAVVLADYQGLGAAGPYGFLVGVAEGQQVLDSVRAAHAILGEALSDQLILYGHSQGGNSAGFAAELQPSYAPELRPAGVILAAPAAELPTLLDLAFSGMRPPFATEGDEAVTFLYLAALSYRDSFGLDPFDLLLMRDGQPVPNSEDGFDIFQNVCAPNGGANYLLHRPNDFFIEPSAFPPDWTNAIAANSLGNDAEQPIQMPILMVQGCEDGTIPISTNFMYFNDVLCQEQAPAEFNIFPGASHSGVVIEAQQQMIAWAQDRLAGLVPPTNCGNRPPCPGVNPPNRP